MTRGITGFEPGRLIQALAARGLSQVALANMVGVSPATISKWKSGQQAPEAEALQSLAQVINVTPEWFTRPLPENAHSLSSEATHRRMPMPAQCLKHA